MSLRAQVRACAVIMTEAATVLSATNDEALMQLGWELKRLTVRIYQLLPQNVGGETPAFNAELQRRIDEAVPVQGITGAQHVVARQRYMLSGKRYNSRGSTDNECDSDDQHSPSLLSSSAFGCNNDELHRSHM